MATVTEKAGMALEDAILTRRSVRGYLDKPVPEDDLQKVFQLAQHAPSNCNVQPWRVFVASGASRDRVRDAMVKAATSGIAPNPDYPSDYKFHDEYRRLQIECAVALYTSMSIARDDTEGRARAARRNLQLFDAPHVVFIGMHKNFGSIVAVDLGMYAQSLMLAFTAHGISSCAQGSMRNYPDIVRKEFGVSDDIRILFGISFGYEDAEVPANATRIPRVDLSQCVTFKD